MLKNLNILNIARNIPVPGIDENNIILRILSDIKEKAGFNINIWFPKEIIPTVPLLKGRQKAISILPKSFISMGHRVHSIKYLRLPSKKLSYLFINSFVLLNRKAIIQCKNFNLVHAHTIMPDGFIGLVLKEKYNLPLIVTMRNGDLDKLREINENSRLYANYLKVLKVADKIIVHNYATNQFVKKLGYFPIKVPHGIENNISSEFNKCNTKKIVVVSQLIKRKNIDWVIDAFIKINNPTWKLIIIGEGYCRKRLEWLIQGCNNISFKGKIPRSETLDYLKNSDIFAMTSDDETFGLVYLEAAANHCAIIGKRFTGIYEWLEEGKEALFVNDRKELEDSLKKLMNDAKFRISLSKAAYTKVTNDFTWDKAINRYINLYNNLIK